MAVTREEVIAYLSGLGPRELQELILELEDLWDIERPFIGRRARPTMGTPWPERVETRWAVVSELVLSSAGARRVQVMKAIREVTPIGLAEARALVEGAPSVVLRDHPEPEMLALLRELEALGATVEIRRRQVLG